ncbi:MAG: sugar-binding transcriptional regulator [Lachnospirales bacterium]
MNVLDDTMLVYRVAKHYYIDGYNQNDIAKITGISRPQISRIVKRSIELGIVKIDVTLPDILNVDALEKELANCLDIDNVYIIPSDLNNTMENFCRLSAQKIPSLIDGKKNIGIGWGRSLYGVSLNLEYQNSNNPVFFYPLIGCSGDSNPYLQINNITDRFAERYSGKAHYLNLPAFLKEKSLTSSDKDKLNFYNSIWGKLDVAVIGIGSYGGDEHLYIDEVSFDPYLLEHTEKIQGDILSHLLLKNGDVLNLDKYTHIACPIEALRKTPMVIAVAKGTEKAEIIFETAKRNLITTLITDETTAKTIIKKY